MPGPQELGNRPPRPPWADAGGQLFLVHQEVPLGRGGVVGFTKSVPLGRQGCSSEPGRVVDAGGQGRGQRCRLGSSSPQCLARSPRVRMPGCSSSADVSPCRPTGPGGGRSSRCVLRLPGQMCHGGNGAPHVSTCSSCPSPSCWLCKRTRWAHPCPRRGAHWGCGFSGGLTVAGLSP